MEGEECHWIFRPEASHELPPEIGAKYPDLSHHDSHIVPGTAEHRIHLVALATFEVVSPQQSIVLHVSDYRLHGLSSLEQTLSIPN